MNNTTHTPQDLKIIKVVAGLVEPNTNEKRTLDYRADLRKKEALPGPIVVKVYLEKKPAPTSAGFQLMIEEEPVPRYTEFEGGIFFKLFEADDLDDLDGKRFWFKAQAEEDPRLLKDLLEQAEFKLEANTFKGLDTGKLPTRAEFLRK